MQKIIKKTMDKTNCMQKRESKNYYVALTGILLILTYIVFIVQAENNDDPEIMQYISGLVTGKPDVLPYLMGVPYTYIISRLYLISTAIPWYGLAYVLINTGAVLVICDRFMKRKCTIENYLLFLCLYVSLFIYQLTNIQFTMVAGLSGLAAIMIVYDVCSEEKVRVSDIMFVVLFSFLAYNIRLECGLVVLGVMIYIVLGTGVLLKAWSKNQIICLASCIVVMILSALCNTIYVNSTEWKEYIALAHERSQFMDYESLEYRDNEDIYASVGWDVDLYRLAINWCFMDDSVNRESLEILNLANRRGGGVTKKSVGQVGWEFTMGILYFYLKLPWQSAIFLGWFLCVIADFLYVYIEDLKKIRKFIYAFGFFMIAVVLVMYFIIHGRYNDRSVIMVLSCSIIPGVSSLSMNLNRMHKVDRKVNFLLVFGLIILAASGLNKQWKRTIHPYDEWNDIYEYVAEHKDCVYVGDGSRVDPNDLFRTFTQEEAPTNYAFWGGWLIDSPLYTNHLEANGLQHLNLEDMLDENKYFIGNESCLEYLRLYYNRYADVKDEIYYEADGFIVYGFRRSDQE